MSYEIEGKVHRIGEREQKGSKGFTVRELVLETTSGTFTEYPAFQLTQDRCDLLDAYTLGEQVKVHFDVRGREWNGRYFTNLNCWKIERAQAEPAPNPFQTPAQPAQPAPPTPEQEQEIPF